MRPSRSGFSRWSAVAIAWGWAATAGAQGSTAALGQDELDLTGRNNLVQGAGARAFGMGGAFLARPDDATAASWNPAGLSYLRHPEFSVAGLRNVFDTRKPFENAHLQNAVADFAAFTYPVEAGEFSGAAQISFQRVIAFNGDRTIDRNSQDPPSQSDLQIAGGFDVLALGTGWRLTRHLRLGVTLNRWFNGYRQVLFRTEPARNRELDVDFALSGWNTNVGLIWTAFESVNVGLVGKTPFTGGVHLRRSRIDYFNNPDRPPDVTTNAFERDDVKLRFPGAVGGGVSWRPLSALTLSADYTRTFWSGARVENYFTLRRTPRPVGSEPSEPGPVDTFPDLPYPTLVDAQKDTEQIRFGAEYVVIGSRLKWPIRAGYFSDQQLVPASNGDAPRFNGFTAGMGVIVGPVLLDVAYLYEFGRFPDGGGSQKTHSLFMSFIYRHGGLP